MTGELELALRIEREGAANISAACSEGLNTAASIFAKGPRSAHPTDHERQVLARFFAATVFNVIGLALPRYKLLPRFRGLQKAVQEANCLAIARLRDPDAQIGSAPFQRVWAEMYDDAVQSDECLRAAMESGSQHALSREYPDAYFAKRHKIDSRSDAGFIALAAALACASVLEETRQVLDATEAGLAKHLQ